MKTISMMMLLLAVSGAMAAEDPFVRPGGPVPTPAAQSDPLLSLTYEVFSLPLDQAAALQRKDPGDGEFYRELAERVAKGEAKQESLLLIRGRSGQKMTVESISEFIYPTEYTPGAVAKGGGGQAAKVPDHGKGPVPALEAPVVPVAFETRNCGANLEAEPILSQDQRIVQLMIVPEHVTWVGRVKWGQGLSEAEMPLFDCQRIHAGVTTSPGAPCFIGTISRPRIQGSEENSAKRVWFAFVTVDIAKN